MDPGLVAFTTVTVLLVLSPGPSLAVVLKNATSGGRTSGVITALGIGSANAMHAVASAIGLSVVLKHSPGAYAMIRVAGACYLVGLGARGLWTLLRSRRVPTGTMSDRSAVAATEPLVSFGQGLVTNLLHPSVALFYLTYLPQFVRPVDSFVARFALLATIHVGFSASWLSICAIAVDWLARSLRRPAFARAVGIASAMALLVMGVVFLVS